MITIIGDIIEFNNRPVGFITIPSGTMRDDFEKILNSGSYEELKEDFDEMEQELNAALDKIKEIKDLCD